MSEGTIRYHIREGHIRPAADGSLNPDDAATLRRAQRVESATDQRGANLLKVRVLGGVVKTRRIRMTIQETQARTIAREPLEQALIERTRQIIARITTWPDRYAGEVAADLGIEVKIATNILRQFTALALEELGDVAAEAQRVCRTT
jgi:hypothetical protein